MGATWRIRTPDPAAVRAVAGRSSLHPLVAALLVNRGLADPAAAERHLRAAPLDLHDPFLLPDMAPACTRLARAVKEGETILVHGDYDVDGVTGTALLMRLFRALGANARWHIPNRLEHGYSFGEHSIARAEEVGARLVISVDNGTSAHDVIARLAARGVDTVVTDHHEPTHADLPRAVAIVNPKLPGSTYPWRELCGGAVAFKLAWGLAQTMNGGRRASAPIKAFLEEATAFVAIATVCDVVPLRDENRVFARYGLKAMRAGTSPGLRALVEIAGLGTGPLTAEDVAFQIGPRLNASGRLGGAEKAVELLLADDEATARRRAVELDGLNRRRREIEQEVWIEARAQAADFADPRAHPVLVLAGEGWHQGVVGIVAARLAEELDRPAVVIGLDGDSGRGSARSRPGFDVLDAIRGAAPHLARFGGHAQAAGLEIEASAVDAARVAICARARAQLASAPPPAPGLVIDGELPFPHLTPTLMRELDLLEPYGVENEKPVLLSRDLRLAEPPRRVGADGAHLMLQLRQGAATMKAMAFRMGGRAGELGLGRPLDVVHTPRWNTFRGLTSLELLVHDFAPGEG
ncbi:MAG: single-stranded-DNA-specific exonuclease RecJ [Planctomycetota bacterium]